MGTEEIPYQRARFSTRLRGDRLYTAGHYWLRKEADDLWRVGFTRFAIRMLGEAVEMGFEIDLGSPVASGQVVGWIEGFKAVSDLYAPMAGRFEGGNPELEKDMALFKKDPYERGWLFALRGTPGEGCMDPRGYVAVLDATIDKMLGQRHDGAEG
jgi:glycine cleavage system H protein